MLLLSVQILNKLSFFSIKFIKHNNGLLTILNNHQQNQKKPNFNNIIIYKFKLKKVKKKIQINNQFHHNLKHLLNKLNSLPVEIKFVHLGKVTHHNYYKKLINSLHLKSVKGLLLKENN